MWLISEDGDGANDNGFKFYTYTRRIHPDIDAYYAIKETSPYFSRVQKIGHEVEWASFKHWMLYLTADVIITTQIGASPCRHITLFLEVIGFLKSIRVFLDHGINLNCLDALRYENNKFSLFTCCAKPDWDYVVSEYGFPDGSVVYTGYARFDDWHHIQPDKDMVVIMPTWRYWFKWGFADEEGRKGFQDTQYFKMYSDLINNPKLIAYAEANHLKILFYPHRAMDKFVPYFHSSSTCVSVLGRFDADIQELLKTASLMVTDYSSVCGDFAYMRKPVVYFQFDEEKYRKIYGESDWFSYRNNGFGPVCETVEDVVAYIIQSHTRGFKTEDVYLERDREMFPLYDEHNCDRIYDAIIGAVKKSKSDCC